LLAAEAGDKAAAADLAARLQPAIDAHQVTPWRKLRLALQQRAEHDAVALEQRARDRFHVVVPLALEERPAPGRFDQPPALLRGREQRAQTRKAVGGGDSGACQLGEAALYVARQQARSSDQLMEEKRAALLECLAHRLRLGGEVRDGIFLHTPMRCILSLHQRDRRAAERCLGARR
jgi:hypothetical protein